MLVVAILLSLVSCSLVTLPGGADTHTDTERTDTDTAPESTDGDDTHPSATPDRLASARDEAAAALRAAPTGNFDGMSFIFTCTSSVAAFGEADSPRALSREKYALISKLNDRLNANIIVTEAVYEDILRGLTEGSGAGMVYTHMLSLDAYRIGTLSYNGHLGNINALPFVDLTKPYYDSDVCAAFTTPAGTWAVYGDGCKDYDDIGAIYYNSRLFALTGSSEPEVFVREGAWTLDKFAECIKAAVASDTFADGTHTAVVTPDTERSIRSFYIGSGMTSVTASETGKLTASDNGALGDRVVSSLKTALSSFKGGALEGTSVEEIFFGGQALFYVGTLGSVEKLYNMGDVWGMLPMPTADGGAEYRSPIDRTTRVVCYPNSAYANETGIMIESLFSASYKLTDAALRDDFLHKYVRNEKTIEMLGYVMGDVRADFLLAFESEYTRYGENTIGTFMSACYSNTAYSRLYKTARTAANRSLAYVK